MPRNPTFKSLAKGAKFSRNIDGQPVTFRKVDKQGAYRGNPNGTFQTHAKVSICANTRVLPV